MCVEPIRFWRHLPENQAAFCLCWECISCWDCCDTGGGVSYSMSRLPCACFVPVIRQTEMAVKHSTTHPFCNDNHRAHARCAPLRRCLRLPAGAAASAAAPSAAARPAGTSASSRPPASPGAPGSPGPPPSAAPAPPGPAAPSGCAPSAASAASALALTSARSAADAGKGAGVSAGAAAAAVLGSGGADLPAAGGLRARGFGVLLSSSRTRWARR